MPLLDGSLHFNFCCDLSTNDILIRARYYLMAAFQESDIIPTWVEHDQEDPSSIEGHPLNSGDAFPEDELMNTPSVDQPTAADILPAAVRTSPIVVLVIGMAGSGKTTLMHRINLHMNEIGARGYFVNLDPAVRYFLCY